MVSSSALTASHTDFPLHKCLPSRPHPTYCLGACGRQALSAGYRDLMINLQIKNQETMLLNVQHHIAELQLIPRRVYDRRNDGDAGRSYLNYMLWRDLRGQ